MLNQKERITKLRQQVSHQFLLLGYIALGIVVLGSITFLNYDGLIVLRAMAIQVAWIGLAFAWYLFTHRKHLLVLFSDGKDIAYHPFETYILNRKKKWDKSYPIILCTGIALAAGFIIALIVFDNTHPAQVLAGLLITFLLAMIWKNWLDFKDKILLQDIRHLLQDHSS